MFGGRGDARRTLELLWRHQVPSRREPGTPGPRPGLSVDEVVESAIEIADDRGIDAVSIRAVARMLGKTPMALYTYVPSRAELVDLMCDHAYADLSNIAPSNDGLGEGNWKDDLTAWCLRLFELYGRHPWLLGVSWARPVLGPHEQSWLEALLAVLDRGHVDPRRRQAVVTACYSIVRGTAQATVDQRRAARETGTSDHVWWQERARALNEIVPDFTARYPQSAALAAIQREARAGGSWEGEPRRVLEQAVHALVAGLSSSLDSAP